MSRETKFHTMMRVRAVLIDEGNSFVYRKDPKGPLYMAFSKKVTLERMNKRGPGLGATDGMIAALIKEENIVPVRAVGSNDSIGHARATKGYVVELAEILFDISQILEEAVGSESFSNQLLSVLNGNHLRTLVERVQLPVEQKNYLLNKIDDIRSPSRKRIRQTNRTI